MKYAIMFLTLCAVTFFAMTALAQQIDAKIIDEATKAFDQFKTGAWLLGVAVIARVLTSIIKGFNPLWDRLADKPQLKWIYPALIALATALATAPLLTDNVVVVIVVSVVAAASSGFTAVGWYHGPTWIGGNPLKHSSTAPITKLPQE